MSTAQLYTPELLSLTVELAKFPPLGTFSAHGEARSPTCGSTLAVDIELDETARIAAVGMRVRACAVGQAAAAIFARHAAGSSVAEIGEAADRIEQWLAGDGELPDWPDLKLIEAARGYPGRHGAILLPWKAAVAALSGERPEG